MNVALHMAISIDGYIAKEDGDSDWVSALDENLFMQRVIEAGCIVVGRKTFDQYHKTIYPIEKVTNVVLTSHSRPTKENNVLFANSPRKALDLADQKRCSNVLIAGGSKISASFLRQKLLNEIFLTVHPLVLGNGIRLFAGVDSETKLELIDSVQLSEGLVQLHYKTLSQ